MREIIRGLGAMKDYCLDLAPHVADNLGYGQRASIYLAIEGARYLGCMVEGGLSSFFSTQTGEPERKQCKLEEKIDIIRQ